MPDNGFKLAKKNTEDTSWLAKAWTAIDRLLVIWKSDLTDTIKRIFFSISSRVDTAIWMNYMNAY